MSNWWVCAIFGVLLSAFGAAAPSAAQESSAEANSLFVEAVMTYRRAQSADAATAQEAYAEVRRLFDRILTEHATSRPAEAIRTDPRPGGVDLALLPQAVAEAPQPSPAPAARSHPFALSSPGDWGQDSVARPTDPIGYDPCRDKALRSCLSELGLSDEAVRFSIAAQAVDGLGFTYAREFRELGAVDLVRLALDFAPYETTALVNGGLGIYRPPFSRSLQRTFRDAASQEMLRRHPRAQNFYTPIVAHRSFADGRQRFVMVESVHEQCRACPVLGSATTYLELDPQAPGDVSIRPVGLLLTDWPKDEAMTADILMSRPQALQVALNMRGYEAGPMDGDIGTRTQTALIEFQLENCLDPSGQLDRATAQALIDNDRFVAPCISATEIDDPRFRRGDARFASVVERDTDQFEGPKLGGTGIGRFAAGDQVVVQMVLDGACLVSSIEERWVDCTSLRPPVGGWTPAAGSGLVATGQQCETGPYLVAGNNRVVTMSLSNELDVAVDAHLAAGSDITAQFNIAPGETLPLSTFRHSVWELVTPEGDCVGLLRGFDAVDVVLRPGFAANPPSTFYERNNATESWSNSAASPTFAFADAETMLLHLEGVRSCDCGLPFDADPALTAATSQPGRGVHAGTVPDSPSPGWEGTYSAGVSMRGDGVLIVDYPTARNEVETLIAMIRAVGVLEDRSTPSIEGMGAGFTVEKLARFKQDVAARQGQFDDIAIVLNDLWLPINLGFYDAETGTYQACLAERVPLHDADWPSTALQTALAPVPTQQIGKRNGFGLPAFCSDLSTDAIRAYDRRFDLGGYADQGGRIGLAADIPMPAAQQADFLKASTEGRLRMVVSCTLFEPRVATGQRHPRADDTGHCAYGRFELVIVDPYAEVWQVAGYGLTPDGVTAPSFYTRQVALIVPDEPATGDVPVLVPRSFETATADEAAVRDLVQKLQGQSDDIDLLYRDLVPFPGSPDARNSLTIFQALEPGITYTETGERAGYADMRIKEARPEKFLIHYDHFADGLATAVLGTIEEVRILSVRDVTGSECEWQVTYRTWLQDPTAFGEAVARASGKDGFTHSACFRSTRQGFDMVWKRFVDL